MPTRSMARVALVLLTAALAGPASAQNIVDIQRTDTQTDTRETARYRTTHDQRVTGAVGRTQVDLLDERAQEVATRIQWGGVGWGVVNHLVVSAYFERDLSRIATLRIAGSGGFTNHDHGREWIAGSEVSFWLHTRSLESTSEYLLLDFDIDIDQSYEYGTRNNRTVWTASNQRVQTSQTGVTVPGYRSRMVGAELGGGAWWGYHRTREEGGSQQARAFVPYVFAGFSSGWIKSSIYHVGGYGAVGKSRYHRVFAHLMFAPTVVWSGIDVDRDLQPDNFPIGVRLGAENIYGRQAAMTFRAELVVMPAGGVGMVLVTLGFGSMFARS